MKSQLQKFILIAIIAIITVLPDLAIADNSKLIEWKAGSDPSGKIVDHELFTAPELRGKAKVADSDGVMKFNGGSMLMGVTDGKKFLELMTQNDELTIKLNVTPYKKDQHGLARIMSYSTDHSTRNFTIGQDGDQFDLRLRTSGENENGKLPDSRFGKIVAGKNYRIGISFKSGHLAIAVNGKVLVERKDIKGTFDSWTEQPLIFGDEVTGDRAWHGKIRGLALFNQAKNLRKKAPRKKKLANPNNEIRETKKVVGQLKKKIDELCAENEEFERRIKAADMAGADLEKQLANSIKQQNAAAHLEKELIQARTLAKREHERAERVSAEILEQVDAQKEIAAELKETIGLVKQERATLLAKFKEQPKIDPEEKKLLIAENDQLTKSLKQAWEKAKVQEKKHQNSMKLAEAHKTEMETARKDYGDLKKQLEGLTAKLATSTKAEAALGKEVKVGKETNKKLSEALQAAKQANQESNKVHADLVAKLETSKKSEADLSKEVRMGSETNRKLSKALQAAMQANEESSAAHTELAAKFEASKQTKANLTKEMQAGSATNKQLSEALQAAQLENKKSSATNAALAAKFEAIQKTEADLSKQVLAGSETNKKLSEALQAADRANKESSKARKDLAAKLQATKKVETDLNNEVAVVTETNKTLAKTLQAVELAHNELAAKLEARKKVEAELKKKNEMYADRAATEIEQLNASVSDLKSQLATTETDSAKISKELTSLMAAKTEAEKKASEHQAETLREMVKRKKAEANLQRFKAEQEAKIVAAKKAEADKKAAAEAKLLDIAPIYFGKNKADSQAQEESLLAQIKEIHATWPNATFVISGHTCTDGTPEANLALSERRAQRVADLIEKSGIPESAIAGVAGKGQTEPKADNATQQGREANRRVEVQAIR